MPDNKETVFIEPENLYGKKLNPTPVPEPQIGIDTDNDFFDSLISNAIKSVIDVSAFNNFNQASRSRDQIYSLLDSMCDDSTIASVLSTYAEYSTETNDEGRIMWCDSSDADINNYVTYLLDAMKVDKNIYTWAYSLCKYGDLYLRLYRKSEYESDDLFEDVDDKSNRRLNEDFSLRDPDLDSPPETLNEAVNIKAYASDDPYVAYLEMQPNPANIFELTKFGKSYAYIKTDITSFINPKNNYNGAGSNFLSYQYQFNKNDIDIYAATEFVHGCLEDNTSRVPEKVVIANKDNNSKGSTYNVKRGQSLFYNIFKIWREASLLENSILLNRITRSSLVRAIGVEIGDMPKENIQPHLQGIKRLFEQSEAINAGQSLSEYTNPGPVENNVYIPTRNGIGALNIQQVGGDVNVTGLADLEYYRDKLFGALGVPKQYFGFTEDGAGFNGGESLSIISSRFAKMVKRIQNALCQTVTDAINLILIDKGLLNYINKFKLKLLAPTTKEEIDRRENTSGKIQLVSDIMNMIADVEEVSKLKILKALLGNYINDVEVITILQQEIDKLESDLKTSNEDSESSTSEEELGDDEPIDLGSDLGLSNLEKTEGESENEAEVEVTSETENSGEEQILPTPDSLGVDFTNSNDL